MTLNPGRVSRRRVCISILLCTALSVGVLSTSHAVKKRSHALATKSQAHKPPVHVFAPVSGVFLPRPAFSPAPVLVYRGVASTAGAADGISFWVLGDGKGGTLRVQAMASHGAALLDNSIEGSASNTEPLWPAWLSKWIVLDFSGWRKFHFATADLTYRPGANVAADAPPASFSDADAIGFDTNRRSGSISVATVAWGGDDAANTGRIVDNFESGAGAWHKYGAPSAVRAVLVGWRKGIAKGGNAALNLDFEDSDMMTSASLSYLHGVVNAVKEPYVVFIPKSPLEPETADALPLDGEQDYRVHAFMCADQIQAASFTLYASQSLTNVSVSQKYPLEIAGHSLETSSVDIHVVKAIKEHGTGLYKDPDATSMTPCLLVKDDREPLAMTDANPPAIRLTGDPMTDIAAHTQKQFWITIAVPRDTPPGEYTGELVVRADQFKAFPVTLSVRVLPLRLMSPSEQYGINFNGKIGASLPGNSANLTDYVSQTDFEAQLRDIAAHGFRYTTLSDRGDDLFKAIDIYTKAGMGSPFLASGFSSEAEAEQIEQQRIKAHEAPFYYLDTNTSNLATDLPAFKQRHMQAAVILPDSDTLATLGGDIDLAIFKIDNPYVRKLMHTGNRESSKRDWLCWSSAQPDPLINRLYGGFLLWHTNMYGAFASDYETSYGTDPFDDTLSPTGPHFGMRPRMLTYPAQGGLIDTVQWEALREGVNDVRYLTTFYAALRECKDNHVAKDLVSEAEYTVKLFLSKPLLAMSDADLQHGRYMIASYAVSLRAAVDGYYKTHSK